MPKTEVHLMSGGHFDIDMVTDVRMYINCSGVDTIGAVPVQSITTLFIVAGSWYLHF